MRQAPSEPSPFVERVYDVIRAIPWGNVVTYGLVAALAGFPRRARAVGWALRILTPRQAAAIPWHRVVGAGGRIAQRGAHGAARQFRRLKAEGVTFRRGRVDMSRHDIARVEQPAKRQRKRKLGHRAHREHRGEK